MAGFFWAATAGEVYEATSPQTLIAHIWFRKLYSIIAFAIVGWIVARVLHAVPQARRAVMSAAFVGAYSALIEIAQKIHGSTESWRWNLFDIGCGVLGGLVGALVYRDRHH
ncbi:MAG: hypothetical protein JOZ59_04505 [Candidatus Eremiobacteraeota bacterium]|nr:hypothetical protein [Candidatus Eremiobacteraeota bacterium]